MNRVLDQEQIKEIIPHRFENLLIDKAELGEKDGAPCSTIELTISDPDPLGRILFSKQWTADKRVIISGTYMEILALGAIARLGSTPGHTYVFSGISDFVLENDHPIGHTLYGEVIKTGDKGPFTISQGVLKDASGTTIAQGSLMAALVPDENVKSKPGDDNEALAPLDTLFTPDWGDMIKHAVMYFCDTMNAYDPDAQTALFSYTYPLDHPCVKGHFPGAPIMMGVMQLISIEDCCMAINQYRVQQGLPLASSFQGHLTVTNQYGHTVASIRGFSVRYYDGSTEVLPQCNLEQIKKISFRGMASPGDVLRLEFQQLQCNV